MKADIEATNKAKENKEIGKDDSWYIVNTMFLLSYHSSVSANGSMFLALEFCRMWVIKLYLFAFFLSYSL